MAGPRVIGVLREHGLERGDDLVGARLWSSIRLPQVPGTQIHERFCKQRGSIGILGELLRHRSHGLRIGLIESFALGPLPAHVPCDQRVDVGLLPGSGAVCHSPSLLDHLDGAMFVFLLHHTINVGAERQRNSPIGHGRLRILLGRSFKRSDRFFVVEGIDESEPLIEIALGLFRCGGDGMVEGTQIVEKRRSDGLVARIGFRW